MCLCVWLLILRLPGGHRNSVLVVNTNRRKWAGAWRASLCLFHPDQQMSPCREKSGRPETAVIGPNVSFTETRLEEIRTKCQSRSKREHYKHAVNTRVSVHYSSKVWTHFYSVSLVIYIINKSSKHHSYVFWRKYEWSGLSLNSSRFFSRSVRHLIDH